MLKRRRLTEKRAVSRSFPAVADLVLDVVDVEGKSVFTMRLFDCQNFLDRKPFYSDSGEFGVDFQRRQGTRLRILAQLSAALASLTFPLLAFAAPCRTVAALTRFHFWSVRLLLRAAPFIRTAYFLDWQRAIRNNIGLFLFGRPACRSFGWH